MCLQINRDGSPLRLIPSLDGGLYQYDGSGIEPVPLAADLLLSNSFRISHDSTVVGGKEVESYGVELNTGRVSSGSMLWYVIEGFKMTFTRWNCEIMIYGHIGLNRQSSLQRKYAN